jgi:hypothetical protein
MQQLRISRNSTPNASAPSSANNAHYSLHNVARPGSGSSFAPPQSPHSQSSSVAALLALELETARERLQRQTDIAVRAEAALMQLAENSRHQRDDLMTQIEELVARLALVQDEKVNRLSFHSTQLSLR